MKTISYIKHLHKAIFIVLLMLALVACGDGTPPAPTPGDGNGSPTGDGDDPDGDDPDGGGDPGGTPNVELRYPSDSSEQIKTYSDGRDGLQRYKAFSFSVRRVGLPGGGFDDIRTDLNRDTIYTDQLEEEEVVLGNAMRANEVQKEALRDLTTATFPLALFRDNTRPSLAPGTNLSDQLKLLYNEDTGEVKFSIKVEERPPVGHPGTDPDDRRWTVAEITAESYQIRFLDGTVSIIPPNAVYRLAIRKSSTDTTLAPLKATGINLVFPEPVMIAGDGPWYVIGELHQDPDCPTPMFGSRQGEASPKDDVLNCSS